MKTVETKTQINHLRSGKKFQVLNPEVDYPQDATSHSGHAGTNHQDAEFVWRNIVRENPDGMTIKLFGEEIRLEVSRSLSGKTVSYYANLNHDFADRFLQTSKKTPYIVIDGATFATIYNGKNAHIAVCPSLIEIL